MMTRKAIVAAFGAAALAATAGGMAVAQLDPTSGTATGGGGGGGGGGGTGVVVGATGCTNANSNPGVTQIVTRSGSSCGHVKSSQRVSHVANGGNGGRAGNARSGNAFNRF